MSSPDDQGNLIKPQQKSAEARVEEYQDLKSTMVDSAVFDAKSVNNYSNMFSSQIGSDEPQIVETGPSDERNRESLIAETQSFTEQQIEYALAQEAKQKTVQSS